jgi:hypothetical protein
MAQGYDGRFFGRRVNCEYVPLLPARAVAQVFDDPRETPYMLVWKDSVGTVKECVHITPHHSAVQVATNELRIWAARDVETGEVEIQRDDGTTDIIRTLLRPLPRNGGSVRLLICPDCLTPRRGLYGWEPGGRFNTSVVRSNWWCRACHKLRYASEGGALVVRSSKTKSSATTPHSPAATCRTIRTSTRRSPSGTQIPKPSRARSTVRQVQ